MRGAVRPFFPGPYVIVNDRIPRRLVSEYPWVEEGPLTDEEKRQFLPPEPNDAVQLERRSAKSRAAAHARKFGASTAGPYEPRFAGRRRVGRYTPPLTGKTWKRRIARLRKQLRATMDARAA